MRGLLAVVSHPDDETFGCGGTLAKHAQAGFDVDVLCLTCNPQSRKAEFETATGALGVMGTIWEGDAVETSPGLLEK